MAKARKSRNASARSSKRHFGWAGKEPNDPRDYCYQVSQATLKALPPSVDLSTLIKSPAINQGNIGSCGPCSAARELLFDQEQTPTLADVKPSILQIYWCARYVMGTVNEDSGVYNRDLCKALNQFGWADESLYPYQPAKFKQKPPANVLADAATRRVTRYEKVPQILEQMKGALAQRDPFILGFMWYADWETSAIAKSGDLTLTAPGAQILGGHDVVIVGYDDATQRFTFINSWGTRWGKNGYGTIPYAQVLSPEKANDFWTLHWDEVVAPPVPPGPVPPGPVVPGMLQIMIDGQAYTGKQLTVQVAAPSGRRSIGVSC